MNEYIDFAALFAWSVSQHRFAPIRYAPIRYAELRMEDTMLIDISKIEVGDEVTVRGRVGRKVSLPKPNDAVASVSFDTGDCSWVNAADILTHTPKPRPLKPGDRVISTEFVYGVVLYVDGQDDDAVVRWTGGHKTICPLKHLKLDTGKL